MKTVIASLKRKMVGEEIFPKQVVYSSRDGKEVIQLGLNRRDEAYLVFLDITNRGPVKVNAFDACFNLSSTGVLLDAVETSIAAIGSASLQQSKLPLFSRIWIGMKEGILESSHLFDLRDDRSERDLTEVYSYKNKLKEHKVRITRTEGSGKQRESSSKTISIEAYKSLRDGLSKLLVAEQADPPNA